MILRIFGLVIGILILGAGIWYLAKEKHDRESRKIYTVVTVVGLVLAAGSLCSLLLTR